MLRGTSLLVCLSTAFVARVAPKEPGAIVAFGESYTSGTGASERDNDPSRMARTQTA